MNNMFNDKKLQQAVLSVMLGENQINEAKVGENDQVKVTHTAGDREDVYTVHDKKTGQKSKHGIHGYFDTEKEKPRDTIKKQLQTQKVHPAAHDLILKHMTEEVIVEAKVGENDQVKVTHSAGDREDVYTVHDKKTGQKSKHSIHGYFDTEKEKPQDTIKKQLQTQKVHPAAHAMIMKHMTESLSEAKKPLHPNQQKLDVHEPEKDELTAKDFEMLRAGKKAKMKEDVDLVINYALGEGWDDMLKAAKERAKPQPSGGSGVKRGTRYGGGRQVDTDDEEEAKPARMKSGARHNMPRRSKMAEENERTFGEYLQAAKIKYGEEEAVKIANDAFNSKDTSIFSSDSEA